VAGFWQVFVSSFIYALFLGACQFLGNQKPAMNLWQVFEMGYFGTLE